MNIAESCCGKELRTIIKLVLGVGDVGRSLHQHHRGQLPTSIPFDHRPSPAVVSTTALDIEHQIVANNILDITSLRRATPSRSDLFPAAPSLAIRAATTSEKMSLYIVDDLCARMTGLDLYSAEDSASSPPSGSSFWWKAARATFAGDWASPRPARCFQDSSEAQSACWASFGSSAGAPSVDDDDADHMDVDYEPIEVDPVVRVPDVVDAYMSTCEGPGIKRHRPSSLDEGIEEARPARRARRL